VTSGFAFLVAGAVDIAAFALAALRRRWSRR
jgi:hypothetical protein